MFVLTEEKMCSMFKLLAKARYEKTTGDMAGKKIRSMSKCHNRKVSLQKTGSHKPAAKTQNRI